MDRDEIRELVSFIVNKNIHEFALEKKDSSLKIKRGAPKSAVPLTPPPLPIDRTTTPTPNAATGESLHIVKSAIVGIFHDVPTPGSVPFVKIGDTVRAGQALGLIECVGLMNEIEADVSGEVVQQLAGNGQAVDYGRPLFEIRAFKKAA